MGVLSPVDHICGLNERSGPVDGGVAGEDDVVASDEWIRGQRSM